MNIGLDSSLIQYKDVYIKNKELIEKFEKSLMNELYLKNVDIFAIRSKSENLNYELAKEKVVSLFNSKDLDLIIILDFSEGKTENGAYTYVNNETAAITSKSILNNYLFKNSGIRQDNNNYLLKNLMDNSIILNPFNLESKEDIEIINKNSIEKVAAALVYSIVKSI